MLSPVDVWIERAMTELYFSDSSTADTPAARPAPAKSEIQAAARSIGKLSGIVQQYIFFLCTKSKTRHIKHPVRNARNAELNTVLKNDNTERLLLSSARRRKNICIVFNIGQAAHMGQTAFKEQAYMPFHAVIRHGIAAVRIALN